MIERVVYGWLGIGLSQPYFLPKYSIYGSREGI